MRFEFIDNHRSEFSVMKMCDVFNVSPSGYFKWKNHQPSQQEIRRNQIKERIVFHFYDTQKRYGSPKITGKLQSEGYTITERTVSIYMRQLGLRACVSKKFKVATTNSNHMYPIAPNKLNQNFTT
ncbi:IS3 family transposase, partial [Virgibacillus litoralis]|uniref:IS3 family transposase n=1 Tax=Virgibacillus litoralis TaxID=578221 RepID=UPI0036075878